MSSRPVRKTRLNALIASNSGRNAEDLVTRRSNSGTGLNVGGLENPRRRARRTIIVKVKPPGVQLAASATAEQAVQKLSDPINVSGENCTPTTSTTVCQDVVTQEDGNSDSASKRFKPSEEYSLEGYLPLLTGDLFSNDEITDSFPIENANSQEPTSVLDGQVKIKTEPDWETKQRKPSSSKRSTAPTNTNPMGIDDESANEALSSPLAEDIFCDSLKTMYFPSKDLLVNEEDGGVTFEDITSVIDTNVAEDERRKEEAERQKKKEEDEVVFLEHLVHKKVIAVIKID